MFKATDVYHKLRDHYKS
jgi:hypothetical protein